MFFAHTKYIGELCGTHGTNCNAADWAQDVGSNDKDVVVKNLQMHKFLKLWPRDIGPHFTVCLAHAIKCSALFVKSEPWPSCACANFVSFAYPLHEVMNGFPHSFCGFSLRFHLLVFSYCSSSGCGVWGPWVHVRVVPEVQSGNYFLDVQFPEFQVVVVSQSGVFLLPYLNCFVHGVGPC